MEPDCWDKIAEYIKLNEDLETAKHLCLEHENLSACRHKRELEEVLSKEYDKVLEVCNP